eukprot:9848237-Heterocapsa_arctica.AAC.1
MGKGEHSGQAWTPPGKGKAPQQQQQPQQQGGWNTYGQVPQQQQQPQQPQWGGQQQAQQPQWGGNTGTQQPGGKQEVYSESASNAKCEEQKYEPQ